MYTCTFLGNEAFPKTLEQQLRSLLEYLIEKERVDTFYIGNQGAFNKSLQWILKDLSICYPIFFWVVFSYLPFLDREEPNQDYTNVYLPNGLEKIHPKRAITWRNRWMVTESDIIITYFPNPKGKAYHLASSAKKQGKIIIDLTQWI